MPVRRLNYTGRKRVAARDVQIRVQETTRGPWFDADLDLEAYGLPGETRVFIEAYRQHQWMRFDFGTVACLQPPQQRALTEFPTAEGVLFRLKGVSACAPGGVLVAEAHGIRPQLSEDEDEERACILPVRSAPELEYEVYRIEYADHPVLLVSQKVGDWREVVRQPAFAALVYPTILRSILTHVLLVEECFDTDDSDDWRSQWLLYASTLPGAGPLPSQGSDPDVLYEWVEAVTSSFCRRFGMIDRFFEYWSGDGRP